MILHDYEEIMYFENALDDPFDFLSYLSKFDWVRWERGGGALIGTQFTTTIEVTKRHAEIENVLEKCFDIYASNKNINKDDYVILKDRFDWKKWNFPMEGMTAHPDLVTFSPDQNRPPLTPDFTFLIYLNDDYVGGEIGYPDKKLYIKPSAGSVIIFPGNLLHEVTDLENGHRYMTSTFAFNKEAYALRGTAKMESM